MNAILRRHVLLVVELSIFAPTLLLSMAGTRTTPF